MKNLLSNGYIPMWRIGDCELTIWTRHGELLTAPDDVSDLDEAQPAPDWVKALVKAWRAEMRQRAARK